MMSLVTTLALVFLLLAIAFAVRWIYGATPIPGVPYNRSMWWLPTGDLVELAIHFYLTGEVFDWFAHQSVRHKSPIVQLFLPSFSIAKPVILVTDIKEIEEIVTRRIHEIDRSSLMHGFFRLFSCHATISMKTRDSTDVHMGHQTFRQQRRLWNCMLTPQMLKQVGAPALHRAVKRMVGLWDLKAQAAPDCAFAIDMDLRQAALEGMWSMLTGQELDLLRSARSSMQNLTDERLSSNLNRGTVKFEQAAKHPELYRALSTIFVCLDWVTTGFSPQFYTWVFEHTWILSTADKIKSRVLDHAIYEINSRVQRRLDAVTSTTPPKCVLEKVLMRHLESGGADSSTVSSAAEIDALKDEIMELLITGHETTASATGWALKYLADRQDVQQKLYLSLATAFPEVVTSEETASPSLSATDIMKADLPYLDAVIAETLRMSSTGPVSFREAVRDCRILGHDIEAGTQIILVTGAPTYRNFGNRTYTSSVATISSVEVSTSSSSDSNDDDTKSWSPTHFEPDRWLQTTTTKAPQKNDNQFKFNPRAVHSLPFSTGPRGCFGKKIALLEMRLVLVEVFLRYRLLPTPSSSPPPTLLLQQLLTSNSSNSSSSNYNSRDSLTRRPVHCYARPEKRRRREEMKR